MRFSHDLAAIHGYLCGDGYVIKNPKTQKHKYYYIGFRNKNEILLKDFQRRFYSVFNVQPIITNDGRCKIQNKEIYYFLTRKCSYYSYLWELPKLSKENLKYWLRAFFDCEAWVENYPGNSRLIGLECCNENGLLSIQKELEKFNVGSQIRKKANKPIWRLTICSQDNLRLFRDKIGFLHPGKNKKLDEAINSFQNYFWDIPDDKHGIIEFIKIKGKTRSQRGEVRLLSVRKENVQNLKKALNKCQINSKVFGPWKNSKGSKYYCLVVKEEVIQK